MFEALGHKLGYPSRRRWSAALPTDGVWLAPDGVAGWENLPVVAIEVVVSESPKVSRGSISTLCAVSPALGVIVLQDEEIRRGFAKKGMAESEIAKRLKLQREHLEGQAARTVQRIVVWDLGQLRRRYQLGTGRKSIYTAA